MDLHPVPSTQTTAKIEKMKVDFPVIVDRRNPFGALGLMAALPLPEGQ